MPPLPGSPLDGNTSSQANNSSTGQQSGQTRSTQSTHRSGGPDKILLGIFDGELYRSPALEAFYKSDAAHVYRNSTNRDGTADVCPDASPSDMPSDPMSRTPSSTVERPTTPPSSKSDPTLDAQTETHSNHHIKREHILILNRCVGEGNTGDVWEGYATLPHQPTPVHIAAKLAFSPEALQSLKHEHDIYQHLGTDPDLPVPTMYGHYSNMPGETGQPEAGLLLLSWVDGIKPQYQELQKSKSSIADALAQLHRSGVVHGDIARRNILINEGKVTLIDFDRAESFGRQSPEVDINALESMCA